MEVGAYTLLGFWAVHLAAVASPGPSFIVVSRTAVGTGARKSIQVAAGLAAGTLVWATGAWFGLAAVFAVLPTLYDVVAIAGGLFLVYIGIQLWRHANEPLPVEAASGDADRAGSFRLGFLTQIANPKVAVFFGSVFTAILPPDPGAGAPAAVFAIVCLNEFAWYSLVALFMSRHAVRSMYLKAKATIDRLTGTVLTALGVRLILLAG